MDMKSTAIKPTTNEIVRGVSGGITQKLHAGLILIVPTIAIVIAGVQAATIGVQLWQIVLALSFWFFTILGITVGFHRMLSHRAFKTNKVIKAFLAILGSMAGQGPAIYWVSNHRRHHRYSDKKGDPHSPNVNGDQKLSKFKGFLHSHIAWSFDHDISNPVAFSRDLMQDKTISWVNKHYYKWLLISVFLPGIIGLMIVPTLEGFLFGLLWGTGVRFFITYHATNAINSVTHLWGYQTYKLDNTSRNNFFMAIPTLGEGWHNNHHACPSSAYFNFSWWELDIGGWVICLLKTLGLVWDVRKPHQKILTKKIINKMESKTEINDQNYGDVE